MTDEKEARPYGRRILYQEGGVEILVALWQPGQVMAPHDHAEGKGEVFLLSASSEEGIVGQQGNVMTLHVTTRELPSMMVFNPHDHSVAVIKDNKGGAWLPVEGEGAGKVFSEELPLYYRKLWERGGANGIG